MMNKGGEEQKEKREEPQKAEKSHGGNATGSGMQKEKSQTHNQTKGTTITKGMLYPSLSLYIYI